MERSGQVISESPIQGGSPVNRQVRVGHTTRENLIHSILAVALDKTGRYFYLVVAFLNRPRYCYYFSSSALCETALLLYLYWAQMASPT